MRTTRITRGESRVVVGHSARLTAGHAGKKMGENLMRMLVLNQLHLKEMTPIQFFRNCYMWRFGKDIPPNSLAEDATTFTKGGAVPKYVIDYMLHVYGTH